GAGGTVPDFPFILDKEQDEMINADYPESILLTSIAVGRMWACYEAFHVSKLWQANDAPPVYRQAFVTANTVLRAQVSSSFESMKNSSQSLRALPLRTWKEGEGYPATFEGLPNECFPLFLKQTEFLQMLDGLLPEPFWARREDGSLLGDLHRRFHEQEGMLEDIPLDDDYSSGSEAGEEAGEEAGGNQRGGGGGGRAGGNAGRERRVVDYQMFLDELWSKIAKSKPEAKELSPANLFQEIHSYIKGSQMALLCPSGKLSREEYLKLPAKMAPAFQGLGAKESLDDLPGNKRGNRDLVYDLFELYEEHRLRLNAYDLPDVIFNLWSRLDKYPLATLPLETMFVDETQDFTQAELSLFVRVCADKNSMFFSVMDSDEDCAKKLIE
ncbi:hypothetical protein T484DRAFT_1788627, partial [Baffinella frigidus]